MDINNKIDELEQIRQEFAQFKAILKQQQILNEKLVRRSVQRDYSKERKSILLVSILTLFALPAFAVNTFVLKNIPLWFFLLTVLYMLNCVAFTFYSVHRYVSDDMITGNIVNVAENMLAYKRLNNRWLIYIGIPSIIVWVSLFFYVVNKDNGDTGQGLMIGGMIGLVIGCICGISYYVNQKRRIDNIIMQINELKGRFAG